jgi:RNA polymerase sigma-70 factor (ECF subfamily)
MSVAALPRGFVQAFSDAGGYDTALAPSAREFRARMVQHLPDLKRYARRLTNRWADAHDLVQETCRRALEAQSRFSGGTDMRAWLCCILRNLHRDGLRRLSRETLVADHDAVPAPLPARDEAPGWVKVSDDDLALAFASLPPLYQRAYVLHAVDGRSYLEIARELRIPCSTVGTRIMRARLWLRQFLNDRITA